MIIVLVYPYVALSKVMMIQLPKILSEKGHEIHIITSDKSNRSVINSDNHSLSGSIQYHTIKSIDLSIPTMVTSFPLFISLRRLIEEIQPDIIHANNLPFLTTYQSMGLAKIFNKPGIVHIHGVLGQTNKLIDYAQIAYIRTLGRRIFNRSTYVICLTEQDAKEIHRLGCPLNKIRIIYNGVNIEAFKPVSEGLANTILWGGRFVPQKGLEYLIEAMRIIVKVKPTVKLIMTGDGPLFPKIFGMVKQFGLSNNISFKGRIPQTEIPNIINSASIYVIPSLKEGMPYALLEAMACGRPVVASNIPGMNDVITTHENGVLVPPRNVVALANAIIRLLDDPALRRTLGRNARKIIIQKYDWRMVAENIEKIYYEACVE